jgi:4-amino-4-deoxy-L-arabinose transferase-like glycosyltransferase
MIELRQSWSRYALGRLVPVLFVALVVRLATIDTQSAWQDEGYTMALVQHPLSFQVPFSINYDIHPPLYYVLLHSWMNVVGFDLVQGRLLSVLCGVASILVLYAVAAILFDRATALCAAILLAVSPVASWYSDELRMYAMVGLFALLALGFLLRAVHLNRWSQWLAYVACAALALYTDYSAAYMLIGAAAFSLLAVRTSRTRLRRWLLCHGALGLLLLPAIVMLYHQAQGSANVAWIPAPTPQVVGAVLLDLISQHTGAPLVATLLGLGLGVLGVMALYADRQQPELRQSHLCLACIVLASLGLPLLASIVQPVFLTQTVLMAVFGLVIIFARGLMTLLRQRRIWGLLALGVVLAVNGTSLNAAYATTLKEDWRSAAQYVRQRVVPSDVLIFDPRYIQLPFDLYWAHFGLHNMQRGYPYDETLLTNAPRSLSTSHDLAQATAHARTVWLITRESETSPLLMDPVGTWLSRHFRRDGRHHFYQVSIYRFTR